jgi:hypothetical protein
MPKNCTFLADSAGDYVFRHVSNNSTMRWHAIEFPAKGADSASPMVFNSDFSGDVFNTDRLYSFWVPKLNSSCTFTASGGLKVAPSNVPSVCALRAGMSLDIFASWHRFQLKGIALAQNVATMLVLSSTGANLLVCISRTNISLSWTTQGGEHQDLVDEHHGYEPSALVNLEYRMNVNSFELHVSCNSSTSNPKAWSGKHKLNFRAFGDGKGHAALELQFHFAKPAPEAPSTFSLPSASLGSVTALTGYNKTRNNPMGLLPSGVPAMVAVLYPISDEAGGANMPPLGMSQPLAQDGIVDVTKPPFNADPGGTIDSTVAIQRAVDYARSHYAVAFFPVGEYLVSGTIIAQQTFRQMATGGVPGPIFEAGDTTHDFLLDGVSSRYVPNYMRGSLIHADKRAKIVLAANSTGYQGASACLPFF